MDAKKTLKGIGKKLREEARDIVEARLLSTSPSCWPCYRRCT